MAADNIEAEPKAPQAKNPATGHEGVSSNNQSGGVTAQYIGQVNQTIINRTEIKPEAAPNIHSPKLAKFWIERSPGVYDVGVVIKLFNLNTEPHLIEGFAIESPGFGVRGRGSWYVQRIQTVPPSQEILEDRFLKGNATGYFKMLIPLAQEMTPNSPSPPMPTPILILTGNWWIQIGNKKLAIAPEKQQT